MTAAEQIRLCQEIIHELVLDSIEGLHEVQCPQDDTCDCALVGRINKAMKGFEPKERCAHERIESFGEGFRKCANCGTVEPPYPRGDKASG